MRLLLPTILLGLLGASFILRESATELQPRGLSQDLYQERLRLVRLLHQDPGTHSWAILQKIQQQVSLLGLVQETRFDLLRHLRKPQTTSPKALEQLLNALALQWDLSTAELALELAESQGRYQQAKNLRCQIFRATGVFCHATPTSAEALLERGECGLTSEQSTWAIPLLLAATKTPLTAGQAFWLLGEHIQEDPSGSRFFLKKALEFKHLQASLLLDGANPRGRYFEPPLVVEGLQLHSVIFSPVPLGKRASRKAQRQFSLQPAFLPGEAMSVELLWSLDTPALRVPSFVLQLDDGFSKATFPLAQDEFPHFIGEAWTTRVRLKAFDWAPFRKYLDLSLCLDSSCQESLPLLSKAPAVWDSGLPIHASFALENRQPQEAIRFLQHWNALPKRRREPLPGFLQKDPRLPLSLFWLSEARKYQKIFGAIPASIAAKNALFHALSDSALSLRGIGETLGYLGQVQPEANWWLLQLAVFLDPASQEAQAALAQIEKEPVRPFQLDFPAPHWEGLRGQYLWSNGQATLSFDFIPGPCQLTLRISGSSALGLGAIARLTWNDELLQTVEVPSSNFPPLTWALDCQAKGNLLQVEFLNDLWKDGEDRNLVLEASNVQVLGKFPSNPDRGLAP